MGLKSSATDPNNLLHPDYRTTHQNHRVSTFPQGVPNPLVNQFPKVQSKSHKTGHTGSQLLHRDMQQGQRIAACPFLNSEENSEFLLCLTLPVLSSSPTPHSHIRTSQSVKTLNFDFFSPNRREALVLP